MRSPTLSVVTLLLVPLAHAAAQQAPGVLVASGSRVKAETEAGKTIEGTLLTWSRDTLVLRFEADTIRIAAASLKKVRVVESPPLWRFTQPTDINFFLTASLPRPSDVAPISADPFHGVLLVGSKTEFAGVDPVTGTAIWTRKDLADLSGVALDVVGSTGYGVITRGEKMEIVDLRTGATRWDTGALSLLAARGWLGLPAADTLLLIYGRTARSASTLMAVELGTGKVRWRQDSLFTIEPKVFGSGGVSYLLGHQPPLADTDTTLVLYISSEGPIRLDARTGAVLWRTDALGPAKIPNISDGYARILRRPGVLFVPSESRLVALRAADGRPAWSTPHLFKKQVLRMDATSHGLLVRGDDWIDLIDPASGRSVWSAPVPLKNSTRMILRGDTVYVAADKKILAIQVPNGSVRTVATVSFKEGEMAGSFGVWDEGFVLGSWHNLMLVDRQGGVRYHHVYPSPKENLGELMRRSGGGATRRPTTRWGSGYVFFYTGTADAAGREGFSVVKVDPAHGREAARLWFDERAPFYMLESASGAVYYEPNDREIVALTFADVTALGHAARNGQGALVERLLSMGVDPEGATDRGWTALHLAARGGHADVVKLLLARGAKVNGKTDAGWSAWMLAAREGHGAIAQILRDAGAESSDAAAALLRGWDLSTRGKITEGLAAYAAAQAADSTVALWPAAWQTLCWNGALWGQAAAVLAACEKAVDRTPASDSRYAAARLARGVARALTGSYPGAVDDLKASLDPESDEEGSGGLQEWIDALHEGRNPFTPAVLESLRRR